jgi:hypothetical protein
MRESQLLQQFLDEGKVRGIRASVLRVLNRRLADPVPEEVRLAVEGTNDPDILGQWLDLASTCQDLDAFRAAISRPNGTKAPE